MDMPADAALDCEQLVDTLIATWLDACERGTIIPPAEFLARYPELARYPQAAAELRDFFADDAQLRDHLDGPPL